MKKLLGLLLLPLLFACGDIPATQEAEATTILGNPDPMSKACATNYVRILGNYCGRTTAPSSVNLTSDGTCRSVDMVVNFGVPASSTAVNLTYSAIIASANLVAFRQITTNLFTENTCTAAAGTPPLILGAREWVAVAATTVYNIGPLASFPTRVGTNAVLFYNSSLSSCVNCSMGLSVVGYYD